jgi:hypothetical protein
MQYFKANNNPNLTCIQVDDVNFANSSSIFVKDVTTNYSTSCVNMLPINLTAVIQNRSCIDGTADIVLNANGGTAPYEFSLNGGAFSPTPVFYVPSGNYTAQVKDAVGSIANATITLAPILTSTVIIDKQTVSVTALGGIAPYQYSFDNGVNYINSNTYTYAIPGNYNFLVRDAYGCAVNQTFVIPATSTLNLTTTNTNALCSTLQYGTITATATGGQAPYSYAIDGGVGQVSGNFSDVFSGSHVVTVKDALGDTKNTTVIITAPPALNNSTVAVNQIITVTASGGTPPYRYSLDGVNYDANNTFAQPVADYTTFVLDANGCFTTYSFYKTPAPIIIGEPVVKLAPGKTLADIVVKGDNIKWYANAGAPTSRLSKTSKKTAETPLPLTTVLENGKTYYASQTIDGFESKQRLSVTVNLTTLATEDFVLTNFEYSPNPVKNILSISNAAIIDEIAITSELGKSILTKKINTLSSEIDLSGLSNGVYFLKVKSEGKEKTVKILK